MTTTDAAPMTTAMPAETATDRSVLALTGGDVHDFLQGLVTNDVRRLQDGPVYAALLTPQGKYLADFFLVQAGDAVLVDVAACLAAPLTRRLSMYKLRADVAIAPWPGEVRRGLGAPPEGAVADPRHAALGWRAYRPGDAGDVATAEGDAGPTGTADGPAAGSGGVDWTALRVAHCIPETGVELIPDESYPLETGLDRLNGVDFRKGCYVGQEVTARMRHKTTLRKGLVTVSVAGDAVPGTAITVDERTVGTLHSRAGDSAIAYLRLDRVAPDMRAGDAIVSLPT